MILGLPIILAVLYIVHTNLHHFPEISALNTDFCKISTDISDKPQISAIRKETKLSEIMPHQKRKELAEISFKGWAVTVKKSFLNIPSI